VLRPIQMPNPGMEGDPDPLGHGRVGLTQGGLEVQRPIRRHMGVVGTALKADHWAVRVGVEMGQWVQLVVEPPA
jgi:hypothetical protein